MIMIIVQYRRPMVSGERSLITEYFLFISFISSTRKKYLSTTNRYTKDSSFGKQKKKHINFNFSFQYIPLYIDIESDDHLIYNFIQENIYLISLFYIWNKLNFIFF